MTLLIVTRPAAEASRWVRELQAAGWSAVGLPLIEFAPPQQAVGLDESRALWPSYDAVTFVSPQAVAGFWSVPPARSDGAGPRCWAPGPGTAKALLRVGVPPNLIDAPDADAPQFDSESLWAVVSPQVRPGFKLLIVRGATGPGAREQRGTGREWLAQQCQAAGAWVEWCVAYQRRAPQWSAEQVKAADAHARDGSIWLFSSSEALVNLRALCPHTDWSAARALVTHPRIADAAQALGFGTIISTRPALADVLQCLNRLP